jgi:DNA-binding transcriptional LysR family regulator
MTLKQLYYAVTIAETGSITEASKKLFLAQPSLTASIRELEKEYGVTIFTRGKKGIEVTKEGEEFLGYARQVLEQANLIEERYNGAHKGKVRFCVSSQHYSFAVEAFVKLLKDLDPELVKGALAGEHFDEYFFRDCKDPAIAELVRELKK